MKKVSWRSVFIILIVFLPLTGCNSSDTNHEAERKASQLRQSASVANANAYNEYLEEINELPKIGVKVQTFGKYETARVDYESFVDAKSELDTQVKADAALNANQRATLSQLIQGKVGQDCDAIVGQINTRVDALLDQSGCGVFQDNDLADVYVNRHGIEGYTRFKMACDKYSR